ncbi:Rpn family recombination-promoting nuclease/putative transposase [Paenibacillus sp. SYP-B4298]|uniref:Rpn family recombination-promoting nuclease/putative transposase n=1 Tax=Paenibacillus sp. SYP-B4298 TaxID=2996034 RepID=UPI0022DE5CBE|nr:Rpn family recombination-promoting nuclease/putative transposase [Paenibacillus sp. SYP-B4298]
MEEEETASSHPHHDTSYRYLLSSKKLFVELLRTFVDNGWLKTVTEEEVEEIPHSFVLPDFKRKEADLVYRVKLNGQDVVFYLLLELQSSVDYRMAYRLLLYQVEIWRYLQHHEAYSPENRKTFRLPPIVPLVLYNGQQSWTAKREFRQLLETEGWFGPELLNFEYLLIDVARYTDEDLLSLSNTIASVFFLDKTARPDQLQGRLEQLMGTFRRLPEENQQKFVSWMANVLKRKLPEKDALEQFIQSVKGESSQMGLEKILDDIEHKGRREGRLEGERAAKQTMVKQLLAKQVDTAIIAEVTGYSPEAIKQMEQESD